MDIQEKDIEAADRRARDLAASGSVQELKEFFKGLGLEFLKAEAIFQAKNRNSGELCLELNTMLRMIYMERARNVALERRVKELESKPQLKYLGTWHPGPHRAGEFVTDHGSMWYCKAIATHDRPGENSEAWQLAVKRGRDAR